MENTQEHIITLQRENNLLNEQIQHLQRELDVIRAERTNGFILDVTDRKENGEVLRKSGEMYRTLISVLPDAIGVCSVQGMLKFLSPKAVEILAVEDAVNIESRNIFEFVHPHDKKRAAEVFYKFVDSDIEQQPQLLMLRDDGTQFFGELNSASIRDSTGKTESIMIVLRDITERRKQEVELIHAKEKAEESEKLKSAFLANMSHEIRTPVNGILGFIHFLTDEDLSNTRRAEYIAMVSSNSKRLLRLVDDIMDIAKIESNQLTLHPVPVDVRNLMKDLYNFYEVQLRVKNTRWIELVLDNNRHSLESQFLFVDPLRLWQILSNLIDNAIKFTRKGYILFGSRLSNTGKLEFFVEDTGIGIPDNQQQVIFERFRQADLSNARSNEGTGLGLAISRSLAQMMGGDITLESFENLGSTFYSTIACLPIAIKDKPLFEKKSEKPIEKKWFKLFSREPFKNKVLMIAQPDTITSLYYEKLLLNTGVTLIHVQTVAQWMETVNSHEHIDLALAGVDMFKNETTESIQKMKSFRSEMPLILVVPRQNEQFEPIIRHSMCSLVITEPVTSQQLIAALNKTIDR